MACRGCGCFYYKLALNSAPSLLGVKAASLMSLYRQELDVYANADCFNRRAACKGLKIKMPVNYYRDDNPELGPMVKWRSYAYLFYSNWLNYYVYQETPYNLEDIK